MIRPVYVSNCPICRSRIPAEAQACPSCHARRKQHKGMSPRGFTAYASLWLASSSVILVLAIRIALAPWLPSGTAPDYALALFGVHETAEATGCRITVRDLQGNQIQTAVAGSCADAEAVAGQAPVARHAPGDEATSTQRWIASGVHSALALGIGILLTSFLRTSLRRVFSRHGTATTWVLRARA